MGKVIHRAANLPEKWRPGSAFYRVPQIFMTLGANLAALRSYFRSQAPAPELEH